MSVAVVGAIGFDDLSTPAGSVERVLGGSAAYAAVAAALLGPVRVVSVVGEDLPVAWLERMAARGVELAGVQVAPGRSFHWSCRYRENLEDRETVFTRPGVFGVAPLVVPPDAARASHVFLTAGDPAQNRTALGQFQARRLTMLDTIQREIVQQREPFLASVAEADVVTINESEGRLLTGLGDAADAGAVARETQALLASHGAATLLLKHGPAGVTIADGAGRRRIPAVAGLRVLDPTGAGDTFAGAALSALEGGASLEEAVRWGCATASFAVEGFGVEGLWAADRAAVEQRMSGLGEGVRRAGAIALSPGGPR